MGTEILDVSDRLLAAVMNGIYQGILISALVALGFRVFGRINAATRHAVWLCTLVLLVMLVVAHVFFHSRPPALQPANSARTVATPGHEIGTPNDAAVAATPDAMPSEAVSSGPQPPGCLTAEQEPLAGTTPGSLPMGGAGDPPIATDAGKVAKRPCPLARTVAPVPSGESPDGTGGSPAPPANHFLNLPYEAQKFSVGNLPAPSATLRGVEPDSPSIAVAPLAASTAQDQSAWFYTAIRRLANPVFFTLALESRAARIASVILLSLCLMLSAIRLFMLLMRLHQIRKLKRQSFPASERLNELFQGLVSRHGAGRKVDLKTLPGSQSSFVLGFLNPVILLPAAPMEPTEAEQILHHELAHVRRRDDWANLLQHCILAAFPFHPAVCWISRRLSLEREIACDDYVLQSSAQPHAYALLLANLAARMQRRPPLLAPGASNNKTQLQQRIDMILNTRRNTSPRLAPTWLTFMASASALFAVTAICLAPRIVLAQSEAAPAAANSLGSPIDEPVQATPAIAPVAASFSPEAGGAVSGEAAPPASPRPPAIGSGPKLKTRGSWPVPGQPSLEPAPAAPAITAVLTAPALPNAPAPLTAQPVPLMAPGSILLSAAPVPEPRPGRAPRSARAESTDSALEERLERLEKMVESLIARGYATQHPYHLKPSPDPIGHIDRKEIAKIEAAVRHQAEMVRKHVLEPKEIQKIEEHAKREAARAVEQVKRAAADAEKVARAEQKRQPKRNFKQGPPRQLDDLRKQLEMLDRERERLEHQIEELERNQEQLEEQQDENQDNDAQSDTAESNSDSIEADRQ